MAQTDSSSREVTGVAYVQVANIRAVVVKNFEQFSKALKQSSAAGHVGETPPSKLALNRIAKEIESELSEKRGIKASFIIDWDHFHESEVSLFHVLDLLHGLKDSLLQISNDQPGKAALLGISSFKILNTTAAPLSVKKDGATVIVTTDLEEFDLSEFKNSIITKIETII